MSAAVAQPIRVLFENRPVTAVPFRGTHAWRADEVGIAAGYKQGRRLVASIRTDWREDFKEGCDFDVLSGEALRSFLAAANDCTPGVQSSGRGGARSLVVLYESGLNLALLLAGTETGRRLRRLLADHVLPQILRTGRVVLPGAPADPEVEALRAENARLRAESLAGVVGPDRVAAWLLDPIARVALLHPKGKRSGLRWVNNKLRNAVQHNGEASSWELLPCADLAKTQRALAKIEADLVKEAKAAAKAACGAPSTAPAVVQLAFSFALDLTARRAG